MLSKYPDFDTFLSRDDDHLCVRSVCTDSIEQEAILTFDSDIDGVVIEWNSLKGISHTIRHVQIMPKDMMSLKPIWPFMKKHLDLTAYSDAQLKQMKLCSGCQICYEFGWEYWIGLLPDKPYREMDSHFIQLQTFTMMRSIREDFKNRLQHPSNRESLLNTLVKNNLNDAKKLFVLPDDSQSIIKVLQEAIDAVSNPPGLKKILFSFRFGEKCKTPIELPISDQSHVSDITAHIAVQIGASDGIDIFWSRYGLQTVVGTRGILTTCMSFAECANFQSNLDGRNIDIKPALRRICKYPERMRFIQLYTDLPHRYPKTRQHPVSGSILISKAVLHDTVKSFQNDSNVYLSEMDNNFNLISHCKCRAEMVISLQDNKHVLYAENYISTEHLEALLENNSLFVPFWCKTGFFCNALRQIGSHMISSLKGLHKKHLLTGNCSGVWCSYQLELALEKLLWGHPLCLLSQQHSVNLGPGAGFLSRSKTDQLGFIALESEYSSIENEEEIPPLKIYSKSEVVQRQIKKMYSFDDYFDSSSVVLGRRTVYILLQDLFDIGNVGGSFENFYLSLKRTNNLNDSQVVGSVTGKQLCDIVGTVERMRYPMVFKEVLTRISAAKRNLLELFEDGLNQLELGFFPAIRIYDCNRHKILNWKYTFKFWRVQPKLEGDLEEYSSVLTSLVITELEKQKLVYANKFRDQAFRQEPFPWIKPCIRKLERLNLERDKLISCLTFISCLALKKNDWFVDYVRLGSLVAALPVCQNKLKSLEIQSKCLLPDFLVNKVWRLHPSIPFRLKSDTQKLKVLEQTHAENIDELECMPDSPANQINPEEDIFQAQRVENMAVVHLPANSKSAWTSEELEILQIIRDSFQNLTESNRYSKYQSLCRERGIPDRTFSAFRKKYTRTAS